MDWPVHGSIWASRAGCAASPPTRLGWQRLAGIFFARYATTPMHSVVTTTCCSALALQCLVPDLPARTSLDPTPGTLTTQPRISIPCSGAFLASGTHASVASATPCGGGRNHSSGVEQQRRQQRPTPEGIEKSENNKGDISEMTPATATAAAAATATATAHSYSRQRVGKFNFLIFSLFYLSTGGPLQGDCRPWRGLKLATTNDDAASVCSWAALVVRPGLDVELRTSSLEPRAFPPTELRGSKAGTTMHNASSVACTQSFPVRSQLVKRPLFPPSSSSSSSSCALSTPASRYR
ncbi:hypothetical protein L1887_54834 [Cichorium endivia]|nr:hypothetical protein L1887_54834 [Cichorium endivia]